MQTERNYESASRPSNRVVALVGLGLLLLASAFAATRSEAAPQGPWVLPATDLSETGEDTNGLATAVGSDGTTAVVWLRENVDRSIAVRVRPPVGDFGPAIEIPGTGDSPDDEDVAVGPDGSVTVVWARVDTDEQQIQTATLGPGAASFGPVENLSVANDDSESPRVVIGPDGTTTVAWEREAGAVDIAESSTRPPDGDFGPAEVLSGPATSLNSVVPAAGPNGAATVTWVELSGADFRVHAATRPAGGSFGAPELLSPAAFEAIEADVAIGPDGTTIVVFTLRDGSDEVIQARVRPPGGAFDAASDLSATSDFVRDPRISIGADGTAAAAWFLDVAPLERQVQSSIRPAGGSFGTPVDISEPDSEINKNVNVAVAPDSTVTLLWREEAGAETVVAAAAKAPDTGFAEPQIISPTGLDADTAQLAVGPDGKATAAWRLNNGPDQIVQAASTQTPSYNISAIREGGGEGRVSSSPAGIDCGTDCSGDFTSLTTVTLTAEPEPDNRFIGWTGPCTGSVLTCEVFMDQDYAAVATFEPLTYNLALNKKGSGKGKVTSSPSGITCGNDCDGDFASLSSVTLTADPDSGNRFTGWTGPCTGSSLTCEVFMNRDYTPSATFCPKKSLKLGKLTRNKKKGTAKLAVTAGGSGTVVLKSTKKVKKNSRKVGGKGTGKVTVKAKGKTLKKLKKKGKVKVKLTLTYKPGGGCATVTKKRTVTLKRR